MDVRPALPAQVELDVGEQRTFELPNHAGGGYRWTVDVSADSVAASVTYAESGPAPGSGARLGQVLHLSGVRAGEGLLALEERRPWEQGTPADSVRVHVVVRDRNSDQREGSREERHG